MRLTSVSENQLNTLEIASLLAWLLKDFGWTLLLPWLSFPAAFVALCLEIYSLRARWSLDTTPEYVHRFAVFAWLLGNSLWMAAELLCEPSIEKAKQFPWNNGPLLGVQPEKDRLLLALTSSLFIAGLGAVFLLYACCIVDLMWTRGRAAEGRPKVRPKGQPEGRGSEAEADSRQIELVFGVVTPSVYQTTFIVPWLFKDIFWLREQLSPALVFASLASLLILDCMRRFGGGVNFAEFAWVTGNVVWILAELHWNDAVLWPRRLSIAILGLDSVFVAALLWNAWRRQDESKEGEYLFGNAGADREAPLST